MFAVTDCATIARGFVPASAAGTNEGGLGFQPECEMNTTWKPIPLQE